MRLCVETLLDDEPFVVDLEDECKVVATFSVHVPLKVRRNLAAAVVARDIIVKDIEHFLAKSEEVHYMDTGEATELLRTIRARLSP